MKVFISFESDVDFYSQMSYSLHCSTIAFFCYMLHSDSRIDYFYDVWLSGIQKLAQLLSILYCSFHCTIGANLTMKDFHHYMLVNLSCEGCA